MHIDFQGRTVLVTGASRGIGHRIALDLADLGAELILTSTKADDGRLREGVLGRHRHLAVDFTDRASRSTFLTALETISPLHVCINNAGTTRHGPIDDADEDDWDVTCDVNLKGPFLVSQAVARTMCHQEYGRIVNITSIWAHISRPGRAVYTATKFGLRGLTTGHAVELARHNVLVNAVAPGFTLTDMTKGNYSEEQLQELRKRIPAGRLAEPRDVSSAVLFLASSLNSYITGQSLVVDGGFSIAG